MNTSPQWDSSETTKEILFRLSRDRSDRAILLARVMAGTSLDGSQTEAMDPDPPFKLATIKPHLEQIAFGLVVTYTYGCGDMDTIEDLIHRSLLTSIDVRDYDAGKALFRQAMENAKRRARELYPNGAPIARGTYVNREELKQLRREIAEQVRAVKQAEKEAGKVKKVWGRPRLSEEELMRRQLNGLNFRQARAFLRDGRRDVRARIEDTFRRRQAAAIEEFLGEYQTAMKEAADPAEARSTVARWLSAWPVEPVAVPKDGPLVQAAADPDEDDDGNDFPL